MVATIEPNFLVDIYYHFEKSCKRKEIFKEFQDFSGIEFPKIIKHCSTRWLSFKSYFSSEGVLLHLLHKESIRIKFALGKRINN